MLLYMMPTVEPIVLRFQYHDFQKKNIVELMKSIWVYPDAHSRRCRVCQRYGVWAITALKEKWLSCYIDFDRVVFELTSRDKNYAFVPHIPPGFLLFLCQPHIRDQIMGKTTTTTTASTASRATAATTTTKLQHEEPTSTWRLRNYPQQSQATVNKTTVDALLINWCVTKTTTTTATTRK